MIKKINNTLQKVAQKDIEKFKKDFGKEVIYKNKNFKINSAIEFKEDELDKLFKKINEILLKLSEKMLVLTYNKNAKINSGNSKMGKDTETDLNNSLEYIVSSEKNNKLEITTVGGGKANELIADKIQYLVDLGESVNLFITAIGKSGTGKTYSLGLDEKDPSGIFQQALTTVFNKIPYDNIDKINLTHYEFNAFNSVPLEEEKNIPLREPENIPSTETENIQQKKIPVETIIKNIITKIKKISAGRLKLDTRELAKNWKKGIKDGEIIYEAAKGYHLVGRQNTDEILIKKFIEKIGDKTDFKEKLIQSIKPYINSLKWKSVDTKNKKLSHWNDHFEIYDDIKLENDIRQIVKYEQSNKDVKTPQSQRFHIFKKAMEDTDSQEHTDIQRYFNEYKEKYNNWPKKAYKFGGVYLNDIAKNNIGNEESSRSQLVFKLEIITIGGYNFNLYLIDPPGEEHLMSNLRGTKTAKGELKNLENHMASLIKVSDKIGENGIINDMSAAITKGVGELDRQLVRKNIMSLMLAIESHFINISLFYLKYLFLYDNGLHDLDEKAKDVLNKAQFLYKICEFLGNNQTDTNKVPLTTPLLGYVEKSFKTDGKGEAIGAFSRLLKKIKEDELYNNFFEGKNAFNFFKDKFECNYERSEKDNPFHFIHWFKTVIDRNKTNYFVSLNTLDSRVDHIKEQYLTEELKSRFESEIESLKIFFKGPETKKE